MTGDPFRPPAPTQDRIAHEIAFYARLHGYTKPASWEISAADAAALAGELAALPCYAPALRSGALDRAGLLAMIQAGGARVRGVALVVKAE